LRNKSYVFYRTEKLRNKIKSLHYNLEFYSQSMLGLLVLYKHAVTKSIDIDWINIENLYLLWKISYKINWRWFYKYKLCVFSLIICTVNIWLVISLTALLLVREPLQVGVNLSLVNKSNLLLLLNSALIRGVYVTPSVKAPSVNSPYPGCRNVSWKLFETWMLHNIATLSCE
jgi:hypothetical protein